MRDPGERARLSARVLALLIRLFPPGFRRAVGPELLRTYLDQLEEMEARAGATARLRFWATTLPILARDLALEWVGALRGRSAASGIAAPSANPGANLIQDVRLALRSIDREPSFALVVLMTLALGIAATTSIFSVFDGILLRPLPYANPQELYQVGTAFGESAEFDAISVPNFREIREQVGGRVRLVAARTDNRVMMRDGVPYHVGVQAVSHDFFRFLGAAPALGRYFVAEDDRPGSAPVAILSDGLWRREWGGDPRAVGATLHLDGIPFTVVGVAPGSFKTPEALSTDVEAWVPLSHSVEDVEERGSYAFEMLARVGAQVPPDRAREELNAAADRLATAYPEENTFNGHPLSLWMRSLHSQTVGEVRGSLGVLMGAVGLLMLITCANVAGLFLARSLDREADLAVRSALGASRGRLIRELLTGGVVLSALAGALGGALTFGGVRAFEALNPGGLPRVDEVAVDWRVFSFALVVAACSGILFGLAPAARIAGGRVDGALREGARTGSEGRGAVALRSGLVVVETALALTLLSSSGLLMGSLLHLGRVDAGFEATGLVAADLRVGTVRGEGPGLRSFARDIVERIRALPGVTSATVARSAPLHPRAGSWSRLAMEGHTYSQESPRPFVRVNPVGDGYAETLGTPVVRGRDLSPADRDPAGGVLVNEAFVQAFWPDESGLGRAVKFGDPESDAPWLPVVGVLNDVNQRSLGRSAEPEIYIPYERRPSARVVLLVRSEGDPERLVPALRRTIWSVEPGLPVDRVVFMEDQRASTMAGPRFQTLLVSAFATLALLLASVGLYGTLSYAVTRRTRELGIRMALGADRRRLIARVMGRGLALTAAGLAVGIGGSLAAGRLLESVLFGIEPADPATMAAVTGALTVAAAVACYLPARRAASTDPTVSLRSE